MFAEFSPSLTDTQPARSLFHVRALILRLPDLLSLNPIYLALPRVSGNYHFLLYSLPHLLLLPPPHISHLRFFFQYITNLYYCSEPSAVANIANMPPSRNKRVIVKDEQAINFKALGLGQQLADTTMEDMPEGDLEISPAKRRKGEYSMQPKAVKARERALVEKFNAVESRLDNLLDRDNGIVVNCFTHAKEKSAPVRLTSMKD
jgi:hypothetical protein